MAIKMNINKIISGYKLLSSMIFASLGLITFIYGTMEGGMKGFFNYTPIEKALLGLIILVYAFAISIWNNQK